MDTKKMCDLATYIETCAGKFDMSAWTNIPKWYCASSVAVSNDCNTAACVAGWCAIAYGDVSKGNFFNFGMETLGLTKDEAYDLFRPYGFDNSVGVGKEARDRAVAVLRGQIPLDKKWLYAKLPASE